MYSTELAAYNMNGTTKPELNSSEFKISWLHLQLQNLRPASVSTVVFYPGQHSNEATLHITLNNITTSEKKRTYWYNSSHEFIKNTNKRHDIEFGLIPLHFSNLWKEKQRAQQMLD